MTDVRELVEDGFALPSSWYTDRAVFEREQQQILRRSWHYVTHTGALAEPGDQVVWDVAGIPIVLTRGVDGEVRGFVNICRHRAHPVVMESCNRTTMQCGYHGWTYDLDGTLRSAPKPNGPLPFEVGDICLVPVQVHVWGPMVWVNPSPDAPSFEDWTAGLNEHLLGNDCDVTQFELVTEHTWEIEANWKVFQDNTIECYHCPTTHPELSRALVTDPAKQELAVGDTPYWIHHRIPFRDGIGEGITYKPPADGPFLYHYQWIFPATYLQHSGKGFDIGTVQVLDVDRIRFRHLWFGPRGLDDETKQLAQRMLEADPTIAQDVDICRRVQQAHASGAAPPGCLVPGREALLIHFYKLIVSMMEGSGH